MKLRLPISIAALMLLGACVKQDLAVTTHPGTARVIVDPDWGSSATRPATYYVQIGDEPAVTVSASSYTSDSVEPGAYRLRIYNNPAGFIKPNDTLTLRLAPQVVVPDYWPTEAPGESFVVSAPAELEWLFSGLVDTTLHADRDYTLSIKMARRVGQIDFTFTPAAGSAEAFADVEFPIVVLTGVASAVNINTGAVSAPDSTMVRLTKNAMGYWTGTARILGIVTTARQELRVRMSGGGGVVLVDSVIDVREKLLPLNSDRTASVNITQSLRVEYPIVTPGLDEPGTTPWDTIPGQPGDAYEEE